MGSWAKRGGTTEFKDELQTVARKFCPDWPAHWLTKTNWKAAKARLATPFPNPVAYYKGDAGKCEVYEVGEELEEGVFALTYAKGVPDELRRDEEATT